jgi:3-oxoacyl-[acyl-carrier-protein] synthase II
MGGRAYLRGIGAFTPLGKTWPEAARALAEGQVAVQKVARFDVTGFPCAVAAEIADVDRGEAERAGDRRLVFALAAAREAWRQARVEVQSRRLGVFIGAESGRTTFATLLRLAAAGGGQPLFDHAMFGAEATKIASEIDALVASPAAVAAAIAGELGAEGPVQTISLACASGSAAIAEATRAIRLGVCDAAICGGVGADVDPLMFAAFGLLGALSARGASRPFDARRDGFILGEGAAMAVLSSERGAPEVEIEVAGIGRTLDAYHLTAPDPAGDGAFRAMRAALLDARLSAVDYVQAHGTSTPLNDAVEAAALRLVLGERIAEARVSSVKGAMGHWIAGAGALGFLCGADAIVTGTLAPTAGLVHPDQGCELPHILGEAIQKEVHSALINSFGFGGANCSIVLRRAS